MLFDDYNRLRVERDALQAEVERLRGANSLTFGELPENIRTRMAWSHEWDNKNPSEQRDWLMHELDGEIVSCQEQSSQLRAAQKERDSLREQIKEKDSQLETAQGLYDDANRDWRAMRAERDALKEQLRRMGEPITNDEWATFATYSAHSAFFQAGRSCADSIIAARTAKEE